MKTFIKFLIIIGIVILSVPYSAISQSGHWINMNPSISPPARSGHGMAYLKNDLVLIFGGDADAGQYLDDTWIYDLNKNIWTKIITDIHPSKRDLPAMAHIDNGRVLLFGGDSYYYDSDETWLFDYETLSWTELKPSRKPSPRERSSSAFLGDKKIIIFSGFPAKTEHGYCNDTWIYDLITNDWDSLISVSPIGSEVGQMCELNDQTVFLYGGWNSAIPNQQSNFNDNWLFNNQSKKWYKQTPKNWNHGRSSSSMVQLKTDLILLFGGDSRDSAHDKPEYQWSDDTWLYLGNDNNWIQLNPLVKPTGRYFHKMAKINDGKVLLFGGINKGEILNDTWLFQYDGTDIAETSNNEQLISPNPASDYIEISNINPMVNHGVEYTGIKILNVYGQTVLSVGVQNLEPLRIDVSGLAPGLYFARIGDRVSKFLKL